MALYVGPAVRRAARAAPLARGEDLERVGVGKRMAPRDGGRASPAPPVTAGPYPGATFRGLVFPAAQQRACGKLEMGGDSRRAWLSARVGRSPGIQPRSRRLARVQSEHPPSEAFPAAFRVCDVV